MRFFVLLSSCFGKFISFLHSDIKALILNILQRLHSICYIGRFLLSLFFAIFSFTFLKDNKL
jgi:hypothetical protein